MGLLDIIFPKYCVNCRKLGSYICADCFSFISFDVSMICLVCGRPTIDGLTHPGCQGKYIIDGAFSALSYNGIIKKLIYSFKYKPYLSDLKNTLVDLFYEAIIQNEIFQKIYEGKPILVPIPLHNTRLKSRGYNHAKILADGISEKLNLKKADILRRTRETKSQSGLRKEERLKNLTNAFSISPSIQYLPTGNLPDGSQGQVFLVDDILTTGSTLLEAAKTLKRKGIKRVWGLTLARG